MVKHFRLIVFSLILAGCATSSDIISSSLPSILSSTTTSIENQSSEANLSSGAPTSTIVTLNSKWSVAMGGVNLTQFYSVTESLTQDLTSVKVVDVQRVLNLDGSFYGYVYEALVDGNGGRNSNRFRVGLANSMYLAFDSVSHKEHASFGLVIINALKNSLDGQTAVYLNAWQIMINANDTLTGKTASETINPIADALESITTHYLSKINVE